jgi:hypothetical protein
MRKRILVLLVAVVMATTTLAAPVFANDGGSHHGSYKNGPWCHWYGHGYEVVWGKSHYYHGDYRAQKYYDYYGDPYYSCGYLYGYPSGGSNFGVSVDLGL